MFLGYCRSSDIYIYIYSKNCKQFIVVHLDFSRPDWFVSGRMELDCLIQSLLLLLAPEI